MSDKLRPIPFDADPQYVECQRCHKLVSDMGCHRAKVEDGIWELRCRDRSHPGGREPTRYGARQESNNSDPFPLHKLAPNATSSPDDGLCPVMGGWDLILKMS